MTHRHRLPQRRLCQTVDFEHHGLDFVASVGYVDGKICEVFLNNRRLGSMADATARDAAIAVSIAMQYGAPAEVLATAMTRDGSGAPSSPIGRLLDIVSEHGK